MSILNCYPALNASASLKLPVIQNDNLGSGGYPALNASASLKLRSHCPRIECRRRYPALNASASLKRVGDHSGDRGGQMLSGA